MKLRLLRRSIWWLLPLVLARSLVPGGFMLAAGEHGLEIVMCSGFGPVSAPTGAAHQHHGDQAPSGLQNDSGNEPTQAGNEPTSGEDAPTHGVPCLYAVSGSPCTSVAWTHETPPPPPAPKIDLCSQATRSCEPPLLDRIRGPPLA